MLNNQIFGVEYMSDSRIYDLYSSSVKVEWIGEALEKRGIVNISLGPEYEFLVDIDFVPVRYGPGISVGELDKIRHYIRVNNLNMILDGV
jgi:hypothetical protein